jgi:hypothetical protein
VQECDEKKTRKPNGSLAAGKIASKPVHIIIVIITIIIIIIIIMYILKCISIKLLCNKSCVQTFNMGQKHDNLIQRKNHNIVGNNNNNNNKGINNNNSKINKRTLYRCLIIHHFIQNKKLEDYDSELFRCYADYGISFFHFHVNYETTSKNALHYQQFYVHVFNTFRGKAVIVPKWRVHIQA